LHSKLATAERRWDEVSEAAEDRPVRVPNGLNLSNVQTARSGGGESES
jgi:hypothetical protein